MDIETPLFKPRDRFFHVMGDGWYAYTKEAIIGPYTEWDIAQDQTDRWIAAMCLAGAI